MSGAGARHCVRGWDGLRMPGEVAQERMLAVLTNNENAPDARCYRIVVRGELDDRDAEWFEGFGISRRADGNTVLCGWVRDQAALHGMLDRVRDLNLTLLEVGVE